MKLALVVLAHTQPELLALLLSRVANPRVRVYLHLDSASPAASFRAARAEAGVAEPVMLRRFRSRWASPEIVDAEVEGLRRAVADGCDYFVLVSGQDLALHDGAGLVDRFARVLLFFR